jgi:5'-phosphate synthase pdxT subunit
MRIGVLALQGAFAEHVAMLDALGARTVLVRLPGHLDGLDGLILPGGESTSMRLLARDFALVEALRAFAASRPVWGVCAGLILLARDIGGEEPLMGALDITVARNAYGRQRDSFVAEVSVADIVEAERPFPAVFIRAPRILAVGSGVTVLARCRDEPVGVRQGRLLATAFHPELTRDGRLHVWFLERCRECAGILDSERRQ